MEQRNGTDSSMTNIAGAVDKFVPPRTLSGWVRDNTDLTRSAEIMVSIYRGDRLLAQGRPTSVRASLGEVPTNFILDCSEPIPDEAVAFEMLRIEALDCYGRPHPIAIWDVVRAESLERLLAVVPAPGMYWARTVLSFLGNCTNVPPTAREAILKLQDLYFQEDSRRLMFTFESLGCDCALGGASTGVWCGAFEFIPVFRHRDRRNLNRHAGSL